MIISVSILLRMRNLSGNNCRKNQNTRFMFNNFFSENPAVFEVMWKIVVESRQATDDNTAYARGMLELRPPPPHTPTHSEYVILIAFPWRQWLRERASVLCYTYYILPVLLIINTLKY
jgi:hypothetical protein